MNMDTNILYGTDMQETLPPPLTGDEKVYFTGQNKWGNRCCFGLSDNDLRTHILSVGSTGSGKSTVMYQAFEQIAPGMSDDDVAIIFDVGGEYLSRYYERENPRHIIIGRHPEALSWNIIDEFVDVNDGTYIENSFSLINELAKEIFEPYVNHYQPFYSLAPKDLLIALLDNIIDGLRRGDLKIMHSTYEIVAFLKTANAEEWKEVFENTSYLGMIEAYLGDGTSNQALGILSELRTVVNDVFSVFEERMRKNGEFSVRNIAQSRKGRICFVEYDVSLARTQSSLLGIWYNLALKYILAENNCPGNAYFFCDELSLMKMSYLSNGLNSGRKHGIVIYAALQSISQLEVTYGKEEAQAILSGFCQCFLFRCFEKSTRTYAAERYGKTFMSISYGAGLSPAIREGSVVEDWDIMQLHPGEAYVHLGNRACDPFYFQFSERFLYDVVRSEVGRI